MRSILKSPAAMGALALVVLWAIWTVSATIRDRVGSDASGHQRTSTEPTVIEPATAPQPVAVRPKGPEAAVGAPPYDADGKAPGTGPRNDSRGDGR